jgi:AcrR family transcriptional regulator
VVTRLTVYRHFPDLEALFAACSQEWERRHPAPDPQTWLDIEDPAARALHGLRELYGWYRKHGEELRPIYRDLEAMPGEVGESTRAEFQPYAEALVAGSRLRGRARARLEAAAGHAVNFWTWRSLCVEQGLDVAEAAELAASLIACAERDS